jgi:hypothetical protein
MKMSELGKLAAKLVAATKNIGVVDKRGTNTKQNYKFVKATDVANEVRAALIAAGVATIFDVESERMWEKQTQSGGTMFFCSVSLRGTFIDAETGETLSGRAVGWGSDSLDKAPYKAMTGALKYILRMNFLIPDEDDPEMDNRHYDEPLRPGSPQPSTPKPAAAPQAATTSAASPDFLFENGIMDCQVLDVRARQEDNKTKKKAMVAVKVNTPNGKGDMLFCFHEKLFPSLATVKKLDRAIFAVKVSGEYLQIEDVRYIRDEAYKDGKAVITDGDLPDGLGEPKETKPLTPIAGIDDVDPDAIPF